MVRSHGRKQPFPASHRYTAEMPRKQAFSQRPSHKVFGHPQRTRLYALSVDGGPRLLVNQSRAAVRSRRCQLTDAPRRMFAEKILRREWSVQVPFTVNPTPNKTRLQPADPLTRSILVSMRSNVSVSGAGSPTPGVLRDDCTPNYHYGRGCLCSCAVFQGVFCRALAGHDTRRQATDRHDRFLRPSARYCFSAKNEAKSAGGRHGASRRPGPT
jgi:hypothetical protein